ncbi:MAG TPA: DUF2934 domain-containing protein [Terracidiphilus sp.]|jgi:hypothetical protein
MAETPKKKTSTTKAATTAKAATADKATTAAKPRKVAAKKGGNGVTADPVSLNGQAAINDQHVPHDEVARLAHTYWQQRGHKHGQHEDDWYRAEQELRGKE